MTFSPYKPETEAELLARLQSQIAEDGRPLAYSRHLSQEECRTIARNLEIHGYPVPQWLRDQT